MNAPHHHQISEAATLAAFSDAIRAAGLTPPEQIEADGALHRFSSDGRPKDKAGSYRLFMDDTPAGWFKCWRSDLSQTWSSKSANEMTPAEREAHRQRIKAMKEQAEAERIQRQQEAQAEAARRWGAAAPAQDHPYPSRKGIKPYGARVERGGLLLVPMRDVDGVLWNVERIRPEAGTPKMGLLGGRRKGLFHLIGDYQEGGPLVICEGFATGASIREATGYPVAVAFNAGNLEAVALALRRKYPSAALILAADDDWRTEGNPGMTKAQAAAQAVGARLAVPGFPPERGEKDTDFNDLHQLHGGEAGLEAVRTCFATAEQSAPVAMPVTFPELADGGEAWTDPEPLPDGLPPVAPFDAELLPQALRGWVSDTALRMQCPADFPAVGVLAAISSLVGARAVVLPKERDDWAVSPNLWALVVGRPGVMKSPALSQAMAPLHRLEANERELWQAEHEAWELDCRVAELAAKANEKKAATVAAKDPAQARALLQPAPAPAEPRARRYVVNDATVEKLADLLTVNPWGLLVYRDELHGLLCSMDRQGQEGARGFYLTGYDGNQGYAVDRIGRGESYVPRVCLAMLGGIQPGKVQSYVREAVAGGASDDGLLQRFGLAVWPDIAREFHKVDQWPDTPAKQAAWAVFERLAQLQPASDTEPQQWRLTPEAQALYWEWVEPFETEIRGDELHPALVSHLSKYRKLVPALALIFALVDTPDSGNVIHEVELLRALAWADYLRTHAERLYSAAVNPETAGAQTLLTKIKTGKLTDRDGVHLDAFTPRQVAVKHWAGLDTPEAVRKAADLLADYGWLVREVARSGAAMGRGRPGDSYLIHPRLMETVA
ncbi:DUF3987 domain-containing protein [Malikia spinosa]|uniref:DUF3987 domain-containing protein n=1 Tax=Malikia spinosa TaxID=86180 RepID=UPI003FA2A32D